MAAIAQRWVGQCKFEHDKGKNRKKLDGTYSGQNLGQSWSKINKEMLSGAVESWYKEHKIFDPSSINSFKYVK